MHLRPRRRLLPLLRHIGHRHLQRRRDVQLRSQSTLRGRPALHQWRLLLRWRLVSRWMLRRRQLHSAFRVPVRLRRKQLFRLQIRLGEQLLVERELPMRQRAGVHRWSTALSFQRMCLRFGFLPVRLLQRDRGLRCAFVEQLRNARFGLHLLRSGSREPLRERSVRLRRRRRLRGGSALRQRRLRLRCRLLSGGLLQRQRLHDADEQRVWNRRRALRFLPRGCRLSVRFGLMPMLSNGWRDALHGVRLPFGSLHERKLPVRHDEPVHGKSELRERRLRSLEDELRRSPFFARARAPNSDRATCLRLRRECPATLGLDSSFPALRARAA